MQHVSSVVAKANCRSFIRAASVSDSALSWFIHSSQLQNERCTGLMITSLRLTDHSFSVCNGWCLMNFRYRLHDSSTAGVFAYTSGEDDNDDYEKVSFIGVTNTSWTSAPTSQHNTGFPSSAIPAGLKFLNLQPDSICIKTPWVMFKEEEKDKNNIYILIYTYFSNACHYGKLAWVQMNSTPTALAN